MERTGKGAGGRERNPPFPEALSGRYRNLLELCSLDRQMAPSSRPCPILPTELLKQHDFLPGSGKCTFQGPSLFTEFSAAALQPDVDLGELSPLGGTLLFWIGPLFRVPTLAGWKGRPALASFLAVTRSASSGRDRSESKRSHSGVYFLRPRGSGPFSGQRTTPPFSDFLGSPRSGV